MCHVLSMPLRAFLCMFALLMFAMAGHADSSSRKLASYYERHMALKDDIEYGWIERGEPRRLLSGVVQVGVSRDAFFALLADVTLRPWTDNPESATTLMRGVTKFDAGASGWFAIDASGVLWRDPAGGATLQRIADDVVAASIGDGADYFVRRDGVVLGTGGNRYGPLSSHGLGDKAEKWGRIFDGASSIATGSRHTLAIRTDGNLWVWGHGFSIEPTKLLEQVSEVAAGDTATIARTRDGALWQWDAGRAQAPRRLTLP